MKVFHALYTRGQFQSSLDTTFIALIPRILGDIHLTSSWWHWSFYLEEYLAE
jgi:hypothetical protein